MVRIAAIFLIAAVGILQSVQAQDGRVLQLGEGSVLAIDGTSNKSDWTVEAGEMSGTFEIGEAGEVVAAEFSVTGRSITSDRGVIMNRLMHNTLQIRQHEEITYTLGEVTGQEEIDGGLRLATIGSLSIAGVANDVEMAVDMIEGEGGLHFTGSHEIDMTDWRIKPPTAMFGSLVVAKTVTVRFDVVAVEEVVAESGQ